MKIVKSHKTFITISDKGLQIVDVDINNKQKIDQIQSDEKWVECIRTVDENRKSQVD